MNSIRKSPLLRSSLAAVIASFMLPGCQPPAADTQAGAQAADTTKDQWGSVTKPLITSMFTADPSAHVFEDRIFIYPSHDIDAGIPETDLGDHFDMRDYHVLSMDSIGGPVTDHGVALDIKNIPWAKRQLWAPDAAFKSGKYYLYFPAKDRDDIFRIGVATASSPAGPFEAMTSPIPGSYSIDPAVFADDDGEVYMYFGGIWGGQLQRWRAGKYSTTDDQPANDQPALGPRVAKLNADMVSFAGPIKEISILDEAGKPLLSGDHNRRFFEACWMHRYNGKYYLSYSTGDTHFICYATGDNPYGPFTYQGIVLNPVVGWTNHHSIVQFRGKWYLFYHDSTLSGGKTHLRSVKVSPLTHLPDGRIETITAYSKPL
ncbi:MAG TPA: glycoside hydrolase family 43 protein [Chryseosolibacter sp.]|nr:glycoside hydrolase family 43 protein [Chryseosolibacter sp.]